MRTTRLAITRIPGAVTSHTTPWTHILVTREHHIKLDAALTASPSPQCVQRRKTAPIREQHCNRVEAHAANGAVAALDEADCEKRRHHDAEQRRENREAADLVQDGPPR